MSVFLGLTTGEGKQHVRMVRPVRCGRQQMPYFTGIQ